MERMPIPTCKGIPVRRHEADVSLFFTKARRAALPSRTRGGTATILIVSLNASRPTSTDCSREDDPPEDAKITSLVGNRKVKLSALGKEEIPTVASSMFRYQVFVGCKSKVLRQQRMELEERVLSTLLNDCSAGLLTLQ